MNNSFIKKIYIYIIMSELSDSSLNTDSSEQNGGFFDILDDLQTVTLSASSCTICILCIIMIAVLANKSYCH